MSKDTETIIKDFKQAVNMTPKEIESWLKTEESKEVGQKDGDNESIGHKSGQKIIEILQKKQDNYSDDDIAHMKKVISYVHRHSAQKPANDIEHSRWLYSLKNWGHDPLK
ncbi:MAG: DUF3140 domain-containing protein [Chroococcus sp. CMT-3BRIN-NPC107]|jgi:predicted Holliday junction resolvase-like endonuclease|nr:DUF3140 domain-containing protein [Chroococcus sp. CMT-3BRIN-NPC107]